MDKIITPEKSRYFAEKMHNFYVASTTNKSVEKMKKNLLLLSEFRLFLLSYKETDEIPSKFKIIIK